MSRCFTSDGRPKRRWATRAEAKAALRQQERWPDFVPGTAPYRGPSCNYFHLGHYPTNEAIRARFRARHRPAS